MQSEAELIAAGLSPAQQDAIKRIGDAGEKGVWTSAAGINWISVALMMKKHGDGKMLEGVDGSAHHCRLNEFGLAVREVLMRPPVR